MGASHLFSQTGCYRICPAALLDSLGSDWFLFTWAQAANSGGRFVQPLLGAAELLWPDRSFWAHPLTVIGFGHTVMASHAWSLKAFPTSTDNFHSTNRQSKGMDRQAIWWTKRLTEIFNLWKRSNGWFKRCKRFCTSPLEQSFWSRYSIVAAQDLIHWEGLRWDSERIWSERTGRTGRRNRNSFVYCFCEENV